MPRTAPSSTPFPPAYKPSRLSIGTSGWAYPTWKPEFYPKEVPAKRFLEFYSSRLSSVEVNYTFRALPTASMLAGWIAATPPGFRFSFKAPQRITHFSRLRDAAAAVTQFVGALLPVAEAGRLGVLLFQLPPNLAADVGLLRAFLQAPVLRGPDAPRIAWEFRHPSWFTEPIYDVLREADAALCIAESDDLATPEIHTARTHTCFRLRRNGGYTPAELERQADHLIELAQERETFVYLKHEDEPTGPLNAAYLLQRCAH